MVLNRQHQEILKSRLKMRLSMFQRADRAVIVGTDREGNELFRILNDKDSGNLVDICTDCAQRVADEVLSPFFQMTGAVGMLLKYEFDTPDPDFESLNSFEVYPEVDGEMYRLERCPYCGRIHNRLFLPDRPDETLSRFAERQSLELPSLRSEDLFALVSTIDYVSHLVFLDEMNPGCNDCQISQLDQLNTLQELVAVCNHLMEKMINDNRWAVTD